MPSSPPFVRPVLAALLTVLLLTASVLVSGPASLLPAARAESAPQAPQAPSAPPPAAEGAPVSMDLVSLTPTSLAPGATLEAQLEVTNTSSTPISDLALELRTRSSRVTERSALAAWQSDTSAAAEGAPVASSAAHQRLAPGESVVLTVRVEADELGYSEAPYYWGTRRLALTVASEEQPLSTLRTFAVWRPEGAQDSITQSVLLPLTAGDAAEPVTDPEAHAASVESGRLSAVRELAPRPDVDWWLDPALLDPPMMPVEADGEESATPSTSSSGTSSAIPEYAPDPASAELAGLLEEAAAGRTVLAMPYARADTVSLRAADAETLLDVVDRRGEQVREDSGISSQATALPVPGDVAGADALEDVLAAGAGAAIVPSSSLRQDPDSAVTPSSVGVYASGRDEGSELTLLAPDPTLSSEFSLLTGSSDTEQIQQRLLAETATIASEYATAPRHLLISPSVDAVLDPQAVTSALEAMEAAPWITRGSTGDLLEIAEDRSWTGDPRDDSGEPYALGRIDPVQIRPSGPSGSGRWEHLPSAVEPRLLDPGALTALDNAWTDVDVLASAMEDDAPLDAPRREILAGTSMRWRGEPEIPAARAQEASARSAALKERIEVVPASGYNVISDEVSVPITISNGLDTPITARIVVTSDKPLVQIGEPTVVEVPARGQIDAAVEVEAIANGSVTLTTVVTTTEGDPLTAPVDVPLTVNPSWENWTTLVLVIAMALLVVVGVARARRTGSAKRAPGFVGPEDPEELVRSGRSTPDPAVTRDAATGPDASDARADEPPPPSTPPADPAATDTARTDTPRTETAPTEEDRP